MAKKPRAIKRVSSSSKAGKRSAGSRSRSNQEKAIQDEVERLVATNTLANSIEGAELPRRVLDGLASEEWIATFPVDYLIRKRTAVAADRVLGLLPDLTQVSSANRSISLTTREALFPDLLGSNQVRAAIVTIEIKADKQSERQAVTELLAYDHEVRNHLPFLSARDFGLVIIATEFSPLLDHAIASLVTWQRRNILCLKASFEGKTKTLGLRVHLPSCWAPIGQSVLPPDAIRVGMLTVSPKDGVNAEDVESAAFSAMQLVSSEAERSGIHGFIMLSSDYYFNKCSESSCFFLVGLIDPFSFLRSPNVDPRAVKLETPFAEYIRGHQGLSFAQSMAPFEWVLEQADRVLHRYADLEFGSFTTWAEERGPLKRFQGVYNLPIRADALHFQGWGNIDEFLQEMILHPTVQQLFLPHTTQPGIDWTHPATAIHVLDWMSVPSLFPDGKLRCYGFFHLGMRIGRLLAAYQTCERITDGNFRELPHRLIWLVEDLLNALREILYRVHAAESLSAPPTLTLGGPELATRSRASLLALLEWLSNDFTGDGARDHCYFMQIGVNAHVLFDEYYWNGADSKFREELHRTLCEASERYLKASVEFVYDEEAGESERQEVRVLLMNGYGIDVSKHESTDAAADLVDQLDQQLHWQRFEDSLLPMVDEWIPPVFHALSPMSLTDVDWDWFKNQLDVFRNVGNKKVGIVVHPNGVVATANFDHCDIPLPNVSDPEKQVLVCNDIGFEVWKVFSWDDLKSGALAHG